MSMLKLRVPPQDPTHPKTPEPSLQKLRSWLAELPMAHPLEAARQILVTMEELNRTALDADKRHQAVQLLHPVVADLCSILHKHYANTPFPLPSNQRGASETVRRLLTEAAYGCKLVLLHLTEAQAVLQRADPAGLLITLRDAMHHLSRLALESFTVYEREPDGLWGDLHQLIRFTERYVNHVNPGCHAQPELRPIFDAISRTYKKTLLLALASPNHLMQGEAPDLYRRLDRWAEGCRIERVPAGDHISKNYFVDLAGEEPPRYVPANRRAMPAEGRILDIAQLRALLDRRIKELTAGHKLRQGLPPLTLPERMERDMLLRLERAWSGRPERRNPRGERSAPVLMASGLNACYHFVNDGLPFDPYQGAGNTQITLQSPTAERPACKLRGAWALQEQDVWLLSGNRNEAPAQPRDKPLEDTWDQVYLVAPKLEVPAPKPAATGPAFALNIWHQQNEGPGGLCLAAGQDGGVQIRVGEVVVYKTESGPEAYWHTGVARWLNAAADGSIQVGIMALAPRVAAVAVRADDEDAGEEAAYQRGLFLTHGDDKGRAAIMTPPFLYDVGTVLQIKRSTGTTRVRLARLMETSKSFSLFQYETAAP